MCSAQMQINLGCRNAYEMADLTTFLFLTNPRGKYLNVIKNETAVGCIFDSKTFQHLCCQELKMSSLTLELPCQTQKDGAEDPVLHCQDANLANFLNALKNNCASVNVSFQMCVCATCSLHLIDFCECMCCMSS